MRITVPLHEEVKRGTLKGIISTLEIKLKIPQREWRKFLTNKRYRKVLKEHYSLYCLE